MPPYDCLKWQSASFACIIGRGGVSPQKREGDGCTPIGHFPFRAVYYRPDREDRPVTSLPTFALTPQSGWCDDTASPVYNRPILLPSTYGAESLWREDGCYNLMVVMGYNDAPALPLLGSAIFMHLPHDDGRPTAGCLALKRTDLLTLLREGCEGVKAA